MSDNTIRSTENASPGIQGPGMWVYAIFFVGLIAHAFTAPWVKMSNFEPATSVLLRCGIASLLLIPFSFREVKKLGVLNKKGIIFAVLAGLFLGVDFMAFNYSIYYVGSGVAAILLNLQVIILPALAFFFDKEKIPKSYFVIAPLMLLGVVIAGGVFNSTAAAQGPATIYGINLAILGTIAGIISGLCYGFYLYFARKSSLVNKGQFLQPMLLAMLAQLVAPILFATFINKGFDFAHGILANGYLPLNPETTVGDPITAMNWVWMIVLAAIGQAMVWTFIQYGSARMDSTNSAGFLLLSPIATVAVVAPLLFGESPSALQIGGIVVVLLLVAFQNGLLQKFLPKKATQKLPCAEVVEVTSDIV
jgi:drug/metabolite transporter (DMT)-like permease